MSGMVYVTCVRWVGVGFEDLSAASSSRDGEDAERVCVNTLRFLWEENMN